MSGYCTHLGSSIWNYKWVLTGISFIFKINMNLIFYVLYIFKVFAFIDIFIPILLVILIIAICVM